MRRPMSRAAVAAVALVLGAASARAEDAPPPLKAGDGLFPFVLPWDDASPGVANVAGLVPGPAGEAGPIRVEGGHFYAGDRRIRFLGVNLCFGANFPTHAAADKIAARMAKFGINCVRFHHMDTSASPSGLVKADRKTIDPERLERLDYLIAALKKRGIYANLNLHVGRKYPDVPDWPGAPGYFKGVDNFDAAMIRSQKDYARALLHHVNPYTKSRYADEPAVAIVEINNENTLFNEWSGDGLETMPDQYSSSSSQRKRIQSDWASGVRTPNSRWRNQGIEPRASPGRRPITPPGVSETSSTSSVSLLPPRPEIETRPFSSASATRKVSSTSFHSGVNSCWTLHSCFQGSWACIALIDARTGSLDRARRRSV